MREFATDAQLNAENIKAIRNNLGVGGAEVDAAIKKAHYSPSILRKF